MGRTPSAEPRVWVREGDHTQLEEAVRAGGGQVVPLDEANAIVWAADEPEALGRTLHNGIRWVQLSAAGVEDWFKAGVVDERRLWTAAKGVYSGPIAEYCLAMMLAGARDLARVATERSWREPPSRRLAGSALGIVGAGGIGQALIELVVPFRLRVLALTRSGREVPRADVSLGPEGLDRLLTESDYVVLAAPETAETRRLISRERLGLMRPHAWLINVARGALVDTDALVEALREGRIGGAALDVTDPEPLPDGHPLWELPNALVTGHTACTREMGRAAMAERVRENVARFARGEELIGLVNPASGY